MHPWGSVIVPCFTYLVFRDPTSRLDDFPAIQLRPENIIQLCGISSFSFVFRMLLRHLRTAQPYTKEDDHVLTSSSHNNKA